MTSYRPYLLRALYEWIADNGMTPHLLVDATRAGVQVPVHAVKDGRIILNIAERAAQHLQMSNELISFNARFGGVSHAVMVPVEAVLAIYSRETGQGMALPEDTVPASAASMDDDADLMEPEADETDAPPRSGEPAAATPSLSAVPATSAADDGDDDTPPSSPRRTGHLRIVK